jgi:hypothetical protein
MSIDDKREFLRNRFSLLCAGISETALPAWGKMNPQQMVEHMTDYVKIASGKTIVTVITEPERIPKMQAFLMSEKPFPENTPNVLMPDTPPPVRHLFMKDAIKELQSEIDNLISTYNNQPEKTADNSFFGNLNWEQQIQLLHKHATHHLRQFGVKEDAIASK